MPKSLFGRSLLIVGLPLIFLQIFLGYFFFERHWDDVGRRLVLSVAGEIALISEKIIEANNNNIVEEKIFINSNKYFGAKLTIIPDSKLSIKELIHPKKSRLDKALSKSLKERIKFPHTFNTTKKINKVTILVQLPNKILITEISKKRLYSSTTYIFIAVMILSSLFLLGLAIFFLRQQISPLKELSNAADAFGKGDTFFALKPRGADEVRHVTHAFLDMRERIRLHIEQRTDMLAGVSHDLRTPLTRMKLQIEMLEKEEDKIGLKEAFADRETKGYTWNNLMLTKWVDHNGKEHRVLEDFERNKLLVDLHAQPEAIVEEMDQTIAQAKAENKSIDQVGIRFMRFCAKYDLTRINEQAQLYVEPFNARLTV